MWEMYLLLLMQAVSGVGLLILLHRINIMKKQVDEITQEVKEYISFVIEDEEKTEDEKLPETKHHKVKTGSDEAQSSLIQSVLGEIFP